jgi:hypothetical protein
MISDGISSDVGEDDSKIISLYYFIVSSDNY